MSSIITACNTFKGWARYTKGGEKLEHTAEKNNNIMHVFADSYPLFLSSLHKVEDELKSTSFSGDGTAIES